MALFTNLFKFELVNTNETTVVTHPGAILHEEDDGFRQRPQVSDPLSRALRVPRDVYNSDYHFYRAMATPQRSQREVVAMA